MKIRVGFGFDVHQLVAGRELWLGGIRLEHEKGLLGHSDADVALTAGYDVRHGLIGAGVYASHGYERSHVDGVKNTLELLAAYLDK